MDGWMDVSDTAAFTAVPKLRSLVLTSVSIPEGAQDTSLEVQVTTAPIFDLEARADSLAYTVVPITVNFGTNITRHYRSGSMLGLNGTGVIVDETNYLGFKNSDAVAFLSCDPAGNGSSPDPGSMLLTLMNSEPLAIVLYTTRLKWCSLDYHLLNFTTVFSMVDSREANAIVGHLRNNTGGLEMGSKTTIFGSAPHMYTTLEDLVRRDASVAMGIIYGVTGLVGVLFIGLMIYTYHSGGMGHRPFISRQTFRLRVCYGTRGIAQTLLDTLPIIKFKQQKSTDDVENVVVEMAATDGRDATRSQGHDDDNIEAEAQGAASNANRVNTDTDAATPATGDSEGLEDRLACSICVEDFVTGEDVRVLPCDHHFHPACVDTWLVKVSGTCPLCRVDLNKRKNRNRKNLETRRRLSASERRRQRVARFFRFGRPGNSSGEEGADAPRRPSQARRGEGQAADGAAAAEGGEEERRRRITNSLRDRFRIFTRVHGSGRRDS
ncbi:hypothetical protein N3K66_003616 [Trichothecium roseum]|uniref:Uncharacterized protein n=1 Tax=Trichothecium roseum TaxID=47278 RepID=A0ACC0V7G5_9HYPO|nr:hypothetical protein N3K66_003616 [Trichothecium roseum]